MTILIPLREKYTRQGGGAKSIKNTKAGNSGSGRGNKVSWAKGTGLGEKGKVHK